MRILEKLKEYAAGFGIALSAEQLQAFKIYEELLLEWNQKINLTAITAHEEIIVKHFLDSLLLLSAAKPQQGTSIIDVGTGAGFPGIPAKIVRPDIDLTLLDSLQKRVRFLQEVSDALGQKNTLLHGRAEEIGRSASNRGKYDLASARAVASLPVLCEYCLPLLKVGGVFAALKGWDVEEEAAQAKPALQKLGGELAEICKYELPGENRRSIVLIQKRSQTPPRFPRISAKIAKEPL